MWPSALRDLALRATAREVEDDLSRYIRDQDGADPVPLGERVMVAVDHRPIAKTLIRRGWRIAAALEADLAVVYVEPTQGGRGPRTVEEERELRQNLQLADELGTTVVRLRGKVADELAAYARAHNVATVVIGHPTHSAGRSSCTARSPMTCCARCAASTSTSSPSGTRCAVKTGM